VSRYGCVTWVGGGPLQANPSPSEALARVDKMAALS